MKSSEKMAAIRRLYKNILGRDASSAEVIAQLKSGNKLEDIQRIMWWSDEFRSNFDIPTVDPTPLENSVPIFIINLERRPDRKELITSRLNALGIKNYEIVNAVDNRNLSDNLTDVYDSQRAKKIHRELSPAEIACALSHVNIAKKIIDNNLDYAIILEDDAEPNIYFKNFLRDFTPPSQKFDFLVLGSFSSNQYTGRLKIKDAPVRLIEKESIIYLNRAEFNIGQTSLHQSHYPTQILDYVHGAHAYLLSNAGARNLVDINFPVIVEADNIWNYFRDQVKVFFTNPILAHRQHIDSDLRVERQPIEENRDNFSQEFLNRTSNPDFGT